MPLRHRAAAIGAASLVACLAGFAHGPVLAQERPLAFTGARIVPIASPPIENGVLVVHRGRIVAVGTAGSTAIPADAERREAAGRVIMPGLVDTHSHIGGPSGADASDPMQPECRVIDAINVREAALGPGAVDPRPGKSPGTRAKAIAMLRAKLIEARAYAEKLKEKDVAKRPARDLRKEALAQVLAGDLPLLVTVHRQQDILAALRLKEEFGLRMVLDGCAEAYEALDEIKAAGVPVILHPTMQRAGSYGEDGSQTENVSMETAAKLRAAGIPFAIQSGYESYVPKTRVVLFEAAIASAHGLTREQALAAITIDAARILGVESRVGSLERGKDADLALYDGDPFEYTTHCTGVVIGGEVVSEAVR